MPFNLNFMRCNALHKDYMEAIETYNLSEEEEKKVILREYRGLLRALKTRLKKGDKIDYLLS